MSERGGRRSQPPIYLHHVGADRGSRTRNGGGRPRKVTEWNESSLLEGGINAEKEEGEKSYFGNPGG